MSKKTLNIAANISVQKLSHGTGFQAFGLRGADAAMDPFLMVDHYRMSQPTFGPHPHAGFSAVTYMFDDAETGFMNRDSRGDRSDIQPGDLHWTIAGSGVVHDEVPMINGKTAHGLQIFVNLAASKKHMPPGAIHVRGERMPVIVQAGGARVKVAFGAYDDGAIQHAALADFPTEATLLDVQLKSGAAFRYPVPEGINAFALVVSGSVDVAGVAVSAAHAVAFAKSTGDDAEIVLTANEDTQIAVFLGRPHNEPIVRHGPFAMTNPADIARAIEDFQSGKMGTLEKIA